MSRFRLSIFLLSQLFMWIVPSGIAVPTRTNFFVADGGTSSRCLGSSVVNEKDPGPNSVDPDHWQSLGPILGSSSSSQDVSRPNSSYGKRKRTPRLIPKYIRIPNDKIEAYIWIFQKKIDSSHRTAPSIRSRHGEYKFEGLPMYVLQFPRTRKSEGLTVIRVGDPTRDNVEFKTPDRLKNSLKTLLKRVVYNHGHFLYHLIGNRLDFEDTIKLQQKRLIEWLFEQVVGPDLVEPDSRSLPIYGKISGLSSNKQDKIFTAMITDDQEALRREFPKNAFSEVQHAIIEALTKDLKPADIHGLACTIIRIFRGIMPGSEAFLENMNQALAQGKSHGPIL